MSKYSTGGTMVMKPKMDLNERFMNCTRERAIYGDTDFIPISKRLESVSKEDLTLSTIAQMYRLKKSDTEIWLKFQKKKLSWKQN